jgi:hypothetical protein
MAFTAPAQPGASEGARPEGAHSIGRRAAVAVEAGAGFAGNVERLVRTARRR